MKHRFHKLIPFFLFIVLFSVGSGVTEEKVTADCLGQTDIYGYVRCTAGISFTDTKQHRYEKAIDYAQRNAIVKGYSDGSFKPESPINRAEFTKILVESVLGQTPNEPNTRCFPDVESGIWFEKYVCYGKGKLFDGYPDGSFQPTNNVNIAEAAKIISNAFGLSVPSEVAGEIWYGRYLQALENNHSIPGTVTSGFHLVTRGEMVEMIMILNEKLTNKETLSACDFIPERCEAHTFTGYGDQFTAYNIDMQKVRIAWLAWYNAERQKEGLYDYHYNNQLNRSAYIWSEFSKNREEMSHKRIGQTEYYDYNMINEWFAKLGLQFENIDRVTFTENIGWGVLSCNDGECTDELIDAIKSTFDFYMAEKTQDYRPHYNSVMNAYFKEIGLGISIDEATKKYYLTVHYGTKLI